MLELSIPKARTSMNVVILVVLCPYDVYIPVHNVLDACISITRESGRGLGPGNRVIK
jgi:hypothetical protein